MHLFLNLLFQVWNGADADMNRALNHVLDSPEDKIVRSGGGGSTKKITKVENS